MTKDLNIKEVTRFTIGRLSAIGKVAPAQEIINEAYLIVFEKHGYISEEFLKGEIINQIHRYSLCAGVSSITNNISKTITDLDEQICKTCLGQKSLAEFHIHRRYPSGYKTYSKECKNCHNKRNAINLAKRREDPEYNRLYLEKLKKRVSERENTMKQNPRLLEFLKNQKREISAKWQENNREKRRASNRKYKSKKRALLRLQKANIK